MPLKKSIMALIGDTNFDAPEAFAGRIILCKSPALARYSTPSRIPFEKGVEWRFDFLFKFLLLHSEDVPNMKKKPY